MIGEVMVKTIFKSLLASHGYSVIDSSTAAHIRSLGKIHKLKFMKKEDVAALVQGRTPVIFDIGSSVGNTIALYESCFELPAIHAFEPHPGAYESICSRFAGIDAVISNNAAVGAKEGTSEFLIREKSSKSGVHDIAKDISSWDKASLFSTVESVSVPLMTVDSYCAKRGIQHVDFVKIDTEGNSVQVLQGAKKLIQSGCVQVFEVEVMMGFYEHETLYAVSHELCPYGYRLYSLYGCSFWASGEMRGCNAVYVKDVGNCSSREH
jgi:FkbM family methyltransferase